MINNEVFDTIVPLFVIIKFYAGGANDYLSVGPLDEKVSRQGYLCYLFKLFRCSGAAVQYIVAALL